MLLEEVFYYLCTFVGEDARCDLCLGVKGLWRGERVASLGVGCSIDEAAHLCPSDGTCAHGAWLKSDVDSAVGEVLAAEGIGSRGDGLHLCVGGDIVESLSHIVGSCDDLVVAHYDGANGHFVFLQGALCLLESTLHEIIVIKHSCNFGQK